MKSIVLSDVGNSDSACSRNGVSTLPNVIEEGVEPEPDGHLVVQHV